MASGIGGQLRSNSIVEKAIFDLIISLHTYNMPCFQDDKLKNILSDWPVIVAPYMKCKDIKKEIWERGVGFAKECDGFVSEHLNAVRRPPRQPRAPHPNISLTKDHKYL